MNKAISVSLAKIDYDLGQPYIKIIADCPTDYKFNKFILAVHMVSDAEQWTTKLFDASTVIADRDKIELVFPISALEGVSGPAIYDIVIGAIDSNLDEITDNLQLSDTHYVYRLLLNNLLQYDSCKGLDDDIIKKYLILFGHVKALNAGDLDVAKELFGLMHKGFSKCKSNNSKLDCGCHVRY